MARIQKAGKETVEFLEEENLIKVTVPIKIVAWGGKTTIHTPDGAIGQPETQHLQQALIQGHRWIKMLEAGKYDSIRQLSEREKVDKARVSKCIRLTCLAPEIQEDILCNHGQWMLNMQVCMKPFPMLWSEQFEHFKQYANPAFEEQDKQ